MQEYANQIALEGKSQEIYRAQMNAYLNEMRNAAGIFGVDSNEYRKAKTAYQGMATALKQSEKNARDLTRAMYDLNLKPIDYMVNRIKAEYQMYQDRITLKETRGTLYNDPSSALTEGDYNSLIKNNNSNIIYQEQRKEYLLGLLGTEGYEEGSEKYDQLMSEIEGCDAAIKQAYIDNEKWKQSIRTLRWKPVEDLHKDLETARSDFDHLRELFS